MTVFERELDRRLLLRPPRLRTLDDGLLVGLPPRTVRSRAVGVVALVAFKLWSAQRQLDLAPAA